MAAKKKRANLLPHRLTLLFSGEEIAKRLDIMAKSVHASMTRSKRPIAVVVLQGGFIFAADLLRRFPPQFGIDVAFVRCQSYGAGTKSSGRVVLLHDIEPEVDLRGRSVLLIDDILDTGLTLSFLIEHFKKRGATDVRLCVLLERQVKPGARKVHAQFAAFPVKSEFVVGYGLDFDGRYRTLPHLAALPQSGKKKRGAAR